MDRHRTSLDRHPRRSVLGQANFAIVVQWLTDDIVIEVSDILVEPPLEAPFTTTSACKCRVPDPADSSSVIKINSRRHFSKLVLHNNSDHSAGRYKKPIQRGSHNNVEEPQSFLDPNTHNSCLIYLVNISAKRM